ncbi:MAG: DUF4234 domain-containing protein, partial [Blautia sp.]|nr:DUF4234 domain-containing protein [Blautia sp.]
IYDLIFMWTMVNDLNTVCGYVEKDDEDRSVNYLLVVLFSVFTFSIYYYYWLYKQGNRMRAAGEKYNTRIDEGGWSYIVWYLLLWFGGLIGFHLFIKNLNRLARRYNEEISTPFLPSKDPGNGYGVESYPLPQDPAVIDIPDRPRPYGPFDTDTSEGLTVGLKQGTIECISGQYKGANILVPPGDELVIGRNAMVSQLVLADGDISRKHCTIVFKAAPDNAYYVTDHSSWGTFLNGNMRLKKDQETYCPVGSKLTLASGNNQFLLK